MCRTNCKLTKPVDEKWHKTGRAGEGNGVQQIMKHNVSYFYLARQSDHYANMGIYHLRAIIKVDKFLRARPKIDRKIGDHNYAMNQKAILCEKRKRENLAINPNEADL